jgi:hypothetical protein
MQLLFWHSYEISIMVSPNILGWFGLLSGKDQFSRRRWKMNHREGDLCW